MNDVQSAVIIAEKQRHQESRLSKSTKQKAKQKKSKSSKSKRKEMVESSSSSTDASESGSEESENEREGKEVAVNKKCKFKSGTTQKPTHVKLKSQELSAHAVLEDDDLKDFQLMDLPFNLLVAGEIEIILGYDVTYKEKFSRLEVLKSLAYNMEELRSQNAVALYRKIEKGKFKWGSKSDVREFDRQVKLQSLQSQL